MPLRGYAGGGFKGGRGHSAPGEGLRGLAVGVVLLLAGCLSPTAPTAEVASVTPTTVGLPPLANNSTVAVPVWNVGDAWDVSTSNLGASERSTFVVVAASNDAYQLATTSASLATFDAVLDVSYVGKIRASDLAGAQGDKTVTFFDFPLTDGKSWSATWDGVPTEIHAVFASAIATAGGQPGFQITATQAGKPYATYDYVPTLKWWSHIDFAGGYGLKVERATTNWTGAVAVATAKKVFDSDTVFPVATLNTQTFHVDERQTSLFLMMTGGAKTYARGYQLVDPNGTAYPSGGPTTDAQPSGGGVFQVEQFPAAPGDWKISAPVAHTSDGKFVLRVHEVALAKKQVP